MLQDELVSTKFLRAADVAASWLVAGAAAGFALLLLIWLS